MIFFAWIRIWKYYHKNESYVTPFCLQCTPFLYQILKNFSYHLFTVAISRIIFLWSYFWVFIMYHRIFWHMYRESSFLFQKKYVLAQWVQLQQIYMISSSIKYQFLFNFQGIFFSKSSASNYTHNTTFCRTFTLSIPRIWRKQI